MEMFCKFKVAYEKDPEKFNTNLTETQVKIKDAVIKNDMVYTVLYKHQQVVPSCGIAPSTAINLINRKLNHILTSVQLHNDVNKYLSIISNTHDLIELYKQQATNYEKLQKVCILEMFKANN